MPALCSFVLRGKIAERRQRNHPCYQECLLADPSPFVATALADCASVRWLCLRLAIFIFTRLGADFIPKLDEGTFTMMVFRTSSMNIDAKHRRATQD